MKQLFDYQSSFVDEMGRAFAKNRKVIGCLPTGGGKGIILSEIAKRSIAKGNVVCIACHRQEIFQQLFDNLISFGVTPALIAPGSHPKPGHKCYLSMIETFSRRYAKGMTDNLGITFYVLDEIHMGNYYKVVRLLHNEKILGFTATPKSTGKPELNQYFDSIVCGPPVSKLVGLGRLTPGTTYSIKHDFSHVKKKGNDFDDAELMKEFSKPVLREGAVKYYMQYGEGRKALCYNVNVAHSLDVVAQFYKAGVKAAHVDGATSKEDRRAIFRMYEHGDVQVLCNVGVATTGTDIPVTGCIIQNFATMSLVKHIQTLGRGARCYDGKENFTIIDMGRNWVRHDTFGEDIDWNAIFNTPGLAITKKEKKLAKRECDECGAVIKFNLRCCPYCGDFISTSALEEKMMEGATLAEVREYRFKKLPPNIRKSPMDLSYEELGMYARIMGYNPKWVHKIMSLKAKRRTN